MFKGLYTALVTPFTQNGSIDEQALKNLVEQQIQAGVHGLVPVGSTGESPTVTHEENLRVVEIVIKQAAGRVKIIAGTGSNSTDEAIAMTRKAKAIGADACLQVVPYYNKPNQEGLYRHFSSIADQVELPIIMYNIPGRTVRQLETSTIVKLANHRNIVGLKQSVDTLVQMMEVLAAVPADFTVLSGDDILTLPMMAAGCHGIISVASHLVAPEIRAMYDAIVAGRMEEARKLHYQLLPVFQNLFIDTNPIPVKYALALQGRIQEVYRLPLCAMDDSLKLILKKTLQDMKLI